MTKQEAKDLSLEVWRYLAAHPEIVRKADLPKELYQKIMRLHGECPLCHLFITYHRLNCPGCPLSGDDCGCLDTGRAFERWYNSRTIMIRQEAAEEIVRLIEAWDVESAAKEGGNG